MRTPQNLRVGKKLSLEADNKKLDDNLKRKRLGLKKKS